MANWDAEVVNFDGLDPTYNAASNGGDAFENNGRVILHIKNEGGAPRTVTADSLQLSNQGKDNDESVTIPAGEERLFGPFNPHRFNDNAGRVGIDYDDETGLTIAVIKLGFTP